MDAPYTLYGMDVSYFTGKLEAYLRYKRVPYRRVEATWRILIGPLRRHTGVAKVPVVHTPEGDWLQDSTPIIDWFEARWPDGAVLPDDPLQAFCCRLLEDYADEWLWRPALHFRWSHRRDARLLGDRIAAEVLAGIPLPHALRAFNIRRRQYKVYVAGDGVTPATRAHVERVYTDTLARLEAIVGARPFLLGARPCLADFGFFASMFRHFSLDPTPARLMRDTAPAVYEWVARLWNARWDRVGAAWPAAGTLPDGWAALLRDVGEAYLPYLHANAVAWRDGRRRFDCDLQGAPYRALPAVRYRVWCRERLQDHFEALPAAAQPAVRGLLEAHGCWEPLWRDGRIASRLHDHDAPPLCRPRPDQRRWSTSPWNP
ncbi:glutathione S-transferase [bacterium]|nr:glutathione S-transferase [bacterium]